MAEHSQAPDENSEQNARDAEPVLAESTADDIPTVTTHFVQDIDALARTLPLAMRSIADAVKSSHERLVRFLSEHGEERDEEKRTVVLGTEHLFFFQRLDRDVTRASKATVLVPRSFFVNLISQYDAFLGRLIRALLLARPEVLNASDRALTFSELVAFGSLDAARDHIIEKEVEAVLRRSHTEQFEWLETKFGLKLRENLRVWPNFVEVTERRNLYVHTGGRISSQYVQICQKHNIDCCGINVGEVLELSPRYFNQAYEVLFEVGVKLAHVFWRKLLPEQGQAADRHLLSISYHLLVDRQYDLAKTLLDFATEVLKKHASTESRLRFVINRVQAYKWSGNESRAKEILDREDFSALSDMFKLAAAVLRDEFSTAVDLIKRIGADGDLSIAEYREWPLFQRLRQQPDFEAVMTEVFGSRHTVTVREPSKDAAPDVVAVDACAVVDEAIDSAPADRLEPIGE